jgi:hypothetical protein
MLPSIPIEGAAATFVNGKLVERPMTRPPRRPSQKPPKRS